MPIEERMVSIKLFNYDKSRDSNKIIDDMKYPVKTDFYEYGIYGKQKVGNRTLYNFISSYKTSSKTPSFDNGKLKFETKETTRYSLGKFSINHSADYSVLELINCDNLVKSILISEFGKGQVEKYAIPDAKYLKLYNSCIIKTAGSYIVNALSRKFNINIRTEELSETEVQTLFNKGQIKNTSFNGRILMDKELSVKVSKDGNILLYNGSKNPLEWEEVYRFLDEYIY